jgi:hypothetical protein
MSQSQTSGAHISPTGLLPAKFCELSEVSVKERILRCGVHLVRSEIPLQMSSGRAVLGTIGTRREGICTGPESASLVLLRPWNQWLAPKQRSVRALARSITSECPYLKIRLDLRS